MHLGVERRSITFNTAPRGKGSASAWVVAQYPEVRGQARGTWNQASLGFLVVIDGDNKGVLERKKQLSIAPHDPRAPCDRIAIFVPTWSVETWVLWLSGTDVTEAKSYVSEVSPERFRERLESAISAWSSPRANEEKSVPSLSHARTEVKRLPLVGRT